MENSIQLRKLRSEGGVELLKASAGSGKTFSLAREYIRLLLTPDDGGRRDPYAYRHILAVTFTNKATGEMKNRIIEELDILAKDSSSSDHCAYLKQECGFSTDEELRRDASRALTNILNDYGSFHVSTIDSFFQQTLRAFAREIGQVAEYQVELDRDSLVEEAADRVLDSLSENDKGLLRWLSSSAIEQIEQGRGFDLETAIEEFAKGYMSDGYKSGAERIHLDENKAFSEANIEKLKSICKKIVSDYDGLLERTAENVRNYFSGLTDLSSYLKKNLAATGKIDFSKDVSLDGFTTMKTCASDGMKCFVGKKAKTAYGDEGARAAEAVLNEFFDLGDKRLTVRNTARILLDQVYVFRVAESLRTEFDKLLKEKNVLSLNDTNSILRDIIGGTEIPFIYEKLGVRLHHFLLDEFQDTSVIQWDNFLPILRESIAQGCCNLIVGDVKQSIYRWRETDWRIIDECVERDLERVTAHSLATNYRSAANIVNFNNDFYRVLSDKMDKQLERLEGTPNGTIQRIYSDVKQEVSGAVAVPGCVNLEFCEPNFISDNVVKAVLDARDNKGFSLKDIAVIVRTNNQGAEAASALINAGIGVVTNDSLRISSSEAVRRLVARLYRCDNPEEKTMSFYEAEFDPSGTEGGDSILSLSEELLRSIEVDDGDTSYVLAFLDLVRDFEKKNGNSLAAFLKYWEEDGVRKSISSPEGSEAVTVITIHKVKGLDYPCVVLPFPRRGELMKSGKKHWACPELEGTPLEVLEPSLYNVKLSESSQNDLFCAEMVKERRMQYIDTLNTWYVATTRASQIMYMIAPLPSKKLRDAVPSPGGEIGAELLGPSESDTDAGACVWPPFKSVSDALYIYAHLGGGGLQPVETDLLDEAAEAGESEVFRVGDLPRKWMKASSKKKRVVTGMDLVYKSFSAAAGRNRPSLSEKARDFFFPQQIESGSVSDCRMHGTIVHSILENVNVPSDLHRAIDQAVFSGIVDMTEAIELEKWLRETISSVESYGWFSVSAAAHRNERWIYDPSSGELSRPDRVVVKADGSVEIIDYKTGVKSDEHLTQVRNYMESYRRMGYSSVNGYIWYLGVEVCRV